jgi:hypothetical protein
MRFKVLTAAIMKMTAFWNDVAACILVEIDRRFGDDYCFHLKSDRRCIEKFKVLTAT